MLKESVNEERRHLEERSSFLTLEHDSVSFVHAHCLKDILMMVVICLGMVAQFHSVMQDQRMYLSMIGASAQVVGVRIVCVHC
jgi:hypothetical protein